MSTKAATYLSVDDADARIAIYILDPGAHTRSRQSDAAVLTEFQ